MFFEAHLRAVNSPRFTTHSPRFYHPKTTSKHPLFSKPPSKSPTKQRNEAFTNPPDFFSNYDFFRMAFTAIALGELPAGSTVKRVGNAAPAVRMTATSPE